MTPCTNPCTTTRRSFVKGAATVAAGAVASGVLAGCAGTSTSGSSSKEKVLVFAQKNAKVGLDLTKANDQLASSVGCPIAESLMRWTEDLELVPCLLKDTPTVSSDGLTYTCELLSDIKCHDGSTLTAHDVKWSFERMMWPETKFENTNLVSYIKGSADVLAGTTKECTGVVVTDDTHFSITLEKPFAPFMKVLGTDSLTIYPKAAVEAAGDSWGSGTNIVGTGPYKVVSNDDNTEVDYEAFAGWHEGKPKLDKLQIKYIDDANTKMMAFVNGDIDLCDLDSTLLEQYQGDSTVKDQITYWNPLGTYFLNMNLNAAVWQDVRVRQAVSYAINRQELVDTIMHGAGTPANGYLNMNLPGYDSSVSAYEFNPDKAKALLADAGASSLVLDCQVRSTETSLATAIQAYLKDVGVTMNVTTLDSAVWSDLRASGQLETSIMSWSVSYKEADNQLYTFFYSTSAAKRSSFYNNPQFDALLDAARQEMDESKRTEMYRQANDILSRQDWATCPLFYPKRQFVAKPWVRDMAVGALVYHFHDVTIDNSKRS